MDEARPGHGRTGELDLPGGDVDAGDARPSASARVIGTPAPQPRSRTSLPAGMRSSALASQLSRGGDGRASLHAK